MTEIYLLPEEWDFLVSPFPKGGEAMRIVSSNQGSPKKRKMSPTCAGVSRMAFSEYPVRASSFCSAVFLAIQLRRVRRAEAGCMWGR